MDDKIYYVGVLDYMGYTNDDFYFSTLQKATDYFNELLEKAKRDEENIKEEDGEGKNFQESKPCPFLQEKDKAIKRIKEISWVKWHKTSFETVEWETYPDTIFIDEIVLDKVVREINERGTNNE